MTAPTASDIDKHKLEKIRAVTERILDEIGIRLHNGGIVEMLSKKGFRTEGDIVFFSSTQLQEALDAAPTEFTLHAPNPEWNMVIGGDHAEFAPAYGASSIIDAQGNTRDAVLEDHFNFVKLVHQSPHLKVNGGILAQPNDVPAKQSHLIMHYAALTGSDKCMTGMPGSIEQMTELMELTAIRIGGRKLLMAKPHILTMVSPISPLQIDDMGLHSIKVAAEYNQPIIASPGVAAGTTGPIDLASNLAMASAESLAVIIIAQTINPGTPVLFGLQCYGADMKIGNISIGSPAYALQAKYTTALARMYGLPSRCGGSTNDAKALDAQSGYESMLSLFTSSQNRANLMVHSAGILDSFAGISFEKFIMDIEMMEMTRSYLDDLQVDEETLHFDLIKEIGHGGLFLTSADTMKKCRTHTWNPKVAVRGSLKGMTPSEKFLKNIEIQKQKMLTTWKKPETDPEIGQQMAQYLRDKGISEAIIQRIEG